MKIIIIAILILPIFSIVADTINVKPLWIHDGDTFKATLINKAVVDCRIWGIDAPELNQPWGKVSKAALIELIHNKNVEMTTKGTTHGRNVGQVKIGDKDIGLELIKMGLAWHYEKYAPNQSEYAKAQEEAKAAKRGLWSDKTPVAPWDHRSKPQTGQEQ